MKKIYLSVLSFIASVSMMAQTNLALEGTATATAANDEAGLAIDDNEGTRWEAPQSFFAESEDVKWNLDLGSVQEFNTIQIKWEGAYSKSFVISVSEDGTEYTDVVVKTDETLSDLLQNYTFSDVTARYIRFKNVARATQWGVSFYEFRVFKMDAAVLTAIELSAQQSVAKINTPIALTVTGRDQLGGQMDAGDVTFEVSPADAGTVADGMYTPAKAGVATIIAKAGNITSKEVSITAYAGDKIDIFGNWAAMVTPFGDGTQTGSMVGAFDDNMGSLWELHAGTGNSEEDRTYETGFVVDLQSLYDITALSVTFEGACPEDYTIAFAGNDGEYGNEHVVTGHGGMATFTDFFLSEAKEVRYVKFLSTKAATGYGVKIYDFTVYGENKQDIPDMVAPTEFSAFVDADAATFSSVTLNMKATDDVSTNIVYEISYKADGETETHTVQATGKSGETASYVLKGLKPATAYSISVVAKDAKGNAADAIALEATTKAMPDAAPVPAADAANVKSVYSDKYGNAEGFTLPNWEEATITNEIELADGDKSLMLSNMNYRGLEFALMDVTDMETLHVDVFPETADKVRIVPIWRNVETNANFAEIPYVIENLKAGEWNSIDIPMPAFASDDRNGTNIVYQIKLDEGDGSTFIFDNIYFEKIAVEDTEAPVWVSAEATDVADKTAAITVKADDNNENGMLTYTVKDADDEIVATKQAKAGEEAVIELTGLTPETEYTYNVYVKDAAGNETAEAKTVKFTTTAKVAQVTSGTGTIIVQNDVITEAQTLNYKWTFTQNTTTVTLTIECTNPEEITGLVNGNINTWTNGGHNGENTCDSFVSTYTWENVQIDDVLEGSVWWALAGGRAETPKFTYTVEDLTTTGITDINAGVAAGDNVIYNISGQRVSKAANGIFIINGKKVVVKK